MEELILGSTFKLFYQSLLRRETIILDPLHGLSIKLYPGYYLKIKSYGIVISDYEVVIILRLLPNQSLQEITSLIIKEAQLFSAANQDLLFKTADNEATFLINYAKHPSFITEIPNEIANILYETIYISKNIKGKTLLITIFIPKDYSEEARKKIIDIIESIKITKPTIEWKYQEIYDPVSGIGVSRVHIPSNFNFQWNLVQSTVGSTLRDFIFSLSGNNSIFRKDYVLIQSASFQMGFFNNSTSTLIWNGKQFYYQGFYYPQSEMDTIQLVINLWQQETGIPWQLKNYYTINFHPFNRIQYNYYQMILSMMPPQYIMPNYIYTFLIEAQFNERIRKALISANITTMPYSMYSMSLEICLIDTLLSEYDKIIPIFFGFSTSIGFNSQWIQYEAQRQNNFSRQQNQMVLEMNRRNRELNESFMKTLYQNNQSTSFSEILREGEEHNSWISRSWSNALSDQTYLRDPDTGEVFKVDKKSYEDGSYWKDPVSDTIIGNVERNSKLEENLYLEGWKRLEQSLSGLPNTWEK